MSINRDDRRIRYTGFIVLMLAINAIDGMLIRSIADPGRRTLVATAATFDVVAVVTGLYYWMLVRPKIRAWGSLAMIALAGTIHATYFFPQGMAARGIVGGVCEVGLLGFVITQVRRNRNRDESTDPVDSIRAALRRAWIAPGLAGVIAGEISVLYYALFSWRSKPHIPAGTRAFTIYRRGGKAELLGALPIVCLLEIVPLHLLVNHWSAVGAWIASGVSVYGMIWLSGLARAFRLRPVLIGGDFLTVRYGLLFQLHVPRALIAGTRAAGSGDREFSLPRKSTPKLCILLTRAIDAEGLFGIRKRVTRVAITPDDETAFELAMAELLTGRVDSEMPG